MSKSFLLSILYLFPEDSFSNMERGVVLQQCLALLFKLQPATEAYQPPQLNTSRELYANNRTFDSNESSISINMPSYDAFAGLNITIGPSRRPWVYSGFSITVFLQHARLLSPNTVVERSTIESSVSIRKSSIPINATPSHPDDITAAQPVQIND